MTIEYPKMVKVYNDFGQIVFMQNPLTSPQWDQFMLMNWYPDYVQRNGRCCIEGFTEVQALPTLVPLDNPEYQTLPVEIRSLAPTKVEKMTERFHDLVHEVGADIILNLDSFRSIRISQTELDERAADLRREAEPFWSVFWFTLGQFLSRILSGTIYSLSKNWLYNVFVGWFPVFLTKFHLVRNTFTFNLSASFLAFAFVGLCFSTIHRFQKDLSKNLKANEGDAPLLVPDNAFFFRMFSTSARPDHIDFCLVIKWVICFTLGIGSLCVPLLLTYYHIIV
jgi:hypothetical protein